MNWSFSKSPKIKQSFRATFIGEFGAENFKKSPNLVALVITKIGRRYLGVIVKMLFRLFNDKACSKKIKNSKTINNDENPLDFKD